MLSKYFKLFLTIFFFLGLFAFASSSVDAQSCSGTAGCCSSYAWIRPACDPFDPACEPVWTCVQTYSLNCSDFLSPECDTLPNMPAICQGGFFASCSIPNPPPPPASCQPDGLCKPVGVNCCTTNSYSDPSCSGTGLRCGTQTGVPAPGGSCNSNWCTSSANCSSIVGSTQSSGAGYCAAPGDVRCCVPGGGYVPGCGWDFLQSNCTGEGNSRQYIGGVPTQPGCCNGLSENWQGICVCPWPKASCTISINPATVTTAPSGSTWITANVNLSAYNNESIDRVAFSSGNTTVATVNPASDPSNPYNSLITGGATTGNTTVTATAFVAGAPTCQVTIPVAVQAACTVDLVPNSTTMTVSTSQPMVANVTVNSGTVTSVAFNSTNPAIASLSPLVDSTSPYVSNMTGNNIGSTTVNVVVTMSGGTTCTDSSPSSITVTAPGPWWQTVGGNVTAGTSLQSLIPATCSGACDPYLIKTPTSGHPGIAVYGTNSWTANFGAGSVSDPAYNWISSTNINPSNYTYDYAYSLLPSSWTFNAGTGNLNNGASASDGYVYNYTNGDLTLNASSDISNKVVLFVDGNLTISRDIILTNDNSFFMAIVSGNITVDPSITQLDGFYLTDGSFASGSGDQQLEVNGAVVAHGGFSLQRDLEAGNTTNSGELFSYNPRLTLFFPKSLLRDFVVWREVAP